MQKSVKTMQPNEALHGFRLIKKEYVESKSAQLYTMEHEKTGAQLLYFDRKDENKTFCISFKTLPEDDTGVFHILEHSVLNGSEKYPVKEPFVSMLQSSMQTFLNALTYSDKTVFPISSRNEQDFFNLMSVYLDAVFRPLIYSRPEIFMQEGWHYEFDEESGDPFYNGVVFSEMKGAYADVDRLIEDEADRLLFPDSSYGFSSGGRPDSITKLSYESFIAAHERFYHPSNSRIFLDGTMDIDAVLDYIDAEYLSGYERREPDFDFVLQTPKMGEKTIRYEAREGEEELAHMSAAKILCGCGDTQTIYAAQVLADYLAGSNEAPLKRAVLERGLAQDVSVSVGDGIFQPVISIIFRNMDSKSFAEAKDFLPQAAASLLEKGLDREALSASLERAAFASREITEPYGVELALKALDSWLYGGDPLTHIDNERVYDELREKLGTGYFEELLRQMLADPDDKSYLYVLPDPDKGEADEKEERDRVCAAAAGWDAAMLESIRAQLERMRQWQQSEDDEEALGTLPHLELADIPKEPSLTEKLEGETLGVRTLKVLTETNGITYINMYFDVSDFSVQELRELNVLTTCFGELRTKKLSADVLQSRLKSSLGSLSAKIELTSRPGEVEGCRPYLLVSASALDEKADAAAELLSELLVNGCYDETDRIYETVLQNDYFMKQSLINEGHMYAITSALSAFSAESALKEALEGESFVRWFSDFAEGFEAMAQSHAQSFAALAEKAFAKNRLFMGFSGGLEEKTMERLIASLPENSVGEPAEYPVLDSADSAIAIPGGVGFSAMGHNLYALGAGDTGAWRVLASLVSYVYLWSEVRVQGGAYGTGMGVRDNGDVFCYSYRDPNVENSREVFCRTADFLEGFLAQGVELDDIIIGAVNSAAPLLDPFAICGKECMKQLRGVTPQMEALRRREILETGPETLAGLIGTLRDYAEKAKFCAVG